MQHQQNQAPNDSPLSDLTHVDAIIANQAHLQARLSQYVLGHRDHLAPKELARLLTLHGRKASRLGQSLRARSTLSQHISPELDAAANEALAFLEGRRAPHQPASTPHDVTITDIPDADSSPQGPTPPLSPHSVTIDDVIADLAAMQAWIFQYIDQCWHGPDAKPPLRLLAVHDRNASRLSQLLRDRRAIYGAPSDPINQALNQALDDLNQEWRVEL